jgi:heptosyltransferase-3
MVVTSAMRRLGDVLLATPLIRSLRLASPEAAIEALVFADIVGILEGNPDLNGVIALPAATCIPTRSRARSRFQTRHEGCLSALQGKTLASLSRGI